MASVGEAYHSQACHLLGLPKIASCVGCIFMPTFSASAAVIDARKYGNASRLQSGVEPLAAFLKPNKDYSNERARCPQNLAWPFSPGVVEAKPGDSITHGIMGNLNCDFQSMGHGVRASLEINADATLGGHSSSTIGGQLLLGCPLRF